MIRKVKFGFSLYGFVSFLLLMLPNIFWMMLKIPGDTLAQNSQYYLLDIIENIFRILTIILLIILVNRTNTKKSGNFIVPIVLCLVIYYLLWVFYFVGKISPVLLFGMAFLPSVYLILVALWQNNYIAALSGSVFGLIHIVISCLNFQ